MNTNTITFDQFRNLQSILFAEGWALHPTIAVNTWGRNLTCSCCGQKQGFSVTLQRDATSSFHYEGKTYFHTDQRTFDVCPQCWNVAEFVLTDEELNKDNQPGS